MNRNDVLELHFIAPISSLISILKLGLLCHERASKVQHQSVAMPQIQARRSTKVVPNGLPLHRYANLYFHARNPMMSSRRGSHADLCVLRIDPDVLDLPNVVITSQNASSDYVRFYSSPDGLAHLDKDLIYAESWIHADQIEEWQHKSIKCAEILVPNKLDSEYIKGAYISNQATKEQVQALLEASKLNLELSIQRNLFFQ